MVKTCHDGKGETMSKVRTWGAGPAAGAELPQGGRVGGCGTVSLRWGRAKELKWGWFCYKTW